MGAAMAVRLLGKGNAVTVWNRAAEKTRPLAAQGAQVAASPQALVESADIVISSLTDGAALEAVYSGAQGLLAGDVKGKLFIEMSTVRPEVEKALALKVRASGAAFVECPLGGTVKPAQDGRLIGFVGGSAADVARARPLLEQLCRRIEHLGEIGVASSVKLASNLPLLVYWQALGEALLLCRAQGVDPARLIDLFSDTAGGANVLRIRGTEIATALSGGKTGDISFDIDSIRKDLRSMLDEARAIGATLPVAQRTLECFDKVAQDGLGGMDAVTLPVRWAKQLDKT